MPRSLIVALGLLHSAASFQPTSSRAVTRTAPLQAGFATSTRKKKVKKGSKGAKSKDAAGLTTDKGWVPLTELTERVEIGSARAVGKTIQGKPYLVRRLSNGALATTSTECGRCEYPLLQAEQKTFEDSEFVCCDMCGATFNVEDGAPQPSAEGAGKPLFGALLKAKPQKSLLVFENRELKDGSVYVNITPKSKQLFEDEE